MVFVPVGEHDAQQPVPDGADRAEMRDDHVHAQMRVVGKHEAAINHDHAAGRFPQLAVEAYLPQPAQGRYGQEHVIAHPSSPAARLPHAHRLAILPARVFTDGTTSKAPRRGHKNAPMPQGCSAAYTAGHGIGNMTNRATATKRPAGIF